MMHSHLRSFFHFFRDHWSLWPAMFFFLLMVATPLWTGQHVLFNLEPYPDGLIYVGRGLQLASGHGLTLHTELSGREPPFYSVVLAVGYLVTTWPPFFYITNCVLGLITIMLLYRVVTLWQLPRWVVAAGLLLYASHGYVLWLPSVPMAENVALPLFVLALWAARLDLPKHSSAGRDSRPRIGWLTFALTALLLTKYAYIGTVLALGGVVTLRLILMRQWRVLAWLCVMLLTALLGFAGWSLRVGLNPFDLFTTSTFGKAGSSGIMYYSFGFVQANLRFYGRALLGYPTQFLWLTFPFVAAAPLVSLVSVGAALWLRRRDFTWPGLSLAISFASLVPLFAIFYVADARYWIFALPLATLGTWLGWRVLEQHSITRRWQYGAVTMVFFFQVVSQRGFYKHLIVTNWLHRSRAWQYEATQVIAQTVPNTNDTYIVTALPPFLLDFYGDHQFHILPLSNTQEFAQKKEKVWGSEVEYSDLLAYYAQLLTAGKQLYVTNAYLTAQKEFGPAFAAVQNQFALMLVKEGCLGTCNVWELKAKKTTLQISQ